MENQEPVPTDTANLPKNGHTKTVILSSNATLFWRLFVPIFGTVFLTGLLLAFWLTNEEEESYLPMVSALLPSLLMFLIWLGWLLFVRRTLWRLKRVDADDTHIYVTNYWTAVRYLWQDVERFEEKKRLGRRVVNFWLKAPGRFGQIVSFLPGSTYDEWMKEHDRQIVVDNPQ